MKTIVSARNTSPFANIVLTDLNDAILPKLEPGPIYTDVVLSDTNSYDAILSSNDLYTAIEGFVRLIVNGVVLTKDQSLNFMNKTAEVSKWKIVEVSDNFVPYEASVGEYIIVNAVVGNVIINLPALSTEATQGKDIVITRIDDSWWDVIINTTGLDTINNYFTTMYLTKLGQSAKFTNASVCWAENISSSFGKKLIQITNLDSPYPARANDYFEGNATDGNIVSNLPSAGGDNIGKEITFKKMDNSINTFTINGTGGALIDGAASVVISLQYDSITVISNGVNWSII